MRVMQGVTVAVVIALIAVLLIWGLLILRRSMSRADEAEQPTRTERPRFRFGRRRDEGNTSSFDPVPPSFEASEGFNAAWDVDRDIQDEDPPESADPLANLARASGTVFLPELEAGVPVELPASTGEVHNPGEVRVGVRASVQEQESSVAVRNGRVLIGAGLDADIKVEGDEFQAAVVFTGDSVLLSRLGSAEVRLGGEPLGGISVPITPSLWLAELPFASVDLRSFLPEQAEAAFRVAWELDGPDDDRDRPAISVRSNCVIVATRRPDSETSSYVGRLKFAEAVANRFSASGDKSAVWAIEATNDMLGDQVGCFALGMVQTPDGPRLSGAGSGLRVEVQSAEGLHGSQALMGNSTGDKVWRVELGTAQHAAILIDGGADRTVSLAVELDLLSHEPKP